MRKVLDQKRVLPTTKLENRLVSSKLRNIETIKVEIGAYESAIADAERLGRGKLAHIQLLKETLAELKARLRVLEAS
jgi:ferritin-like metal-binding protein YciE